MKKLASIFLTVLFCLGLGFCFTACQGNNPTQQNNAYQITVVDATGAAVADVNVQLCDPVTQVCLTDKFTTDANGKVSCAVAQKAYDVHVFSTDWMTEYEVVGTSQTPTTYGELLITIIK